MFKQISSWAIFFILMTGCTMQQATPTPKGSLTPNAYVELRDAVFNIKPQQLELSPLEPDEPYGILMEYYIDETVVTLISLTTGDASLYFSTGGGAIGGVNHQSVREVAKKFVTESKNYSSQMQKTNSYPLPAAGNVRFYVLTPEGILTLETSEQELGEQKSTLSPLFNAGQEVITALLLVTDKK